MRRLIVLIAPALLAAGCANSKTVTVTTTETVTTATTATQTTAATTTVRVYLLRDGKVAPVGRQVSETLGVANAALNQLSKGPLPNESALGLTTQLPAATFTLALHNGILDLGNVQATLSNEALAQLVYTLTQFSTVKSVRLNAKSYTRADFEDQTPVILVESPLPFQAVSAPLRVTGTANTFEATFEYELRDPAGKVISHDFETATSGSGTRGTYDFTVPFEAPNGLGKLVVFERSAADGSKIHIVEIPLTLAQ
jgi:germination protein M